MFRFHVVQAEFGDCLILEYGSKDQPRFTLIDGGPPQNFTDNLDPVLREIAPRSPALDLAVLSHVDNDHVTGMVDYFAELQGGGAGLPRPKELWHNSWGRALDPDGAITPRLKALISATRTAAMPNAGNAVLGIDEGNALRTKAKVLGIPINQSIPGADLITVDKVKAPIRLGNLSLQVVGPTQANLDRLHKDWLAWLEKHEDAVAGDDPMVMANSDRSVPNLSSIMLLAEADGKSVLLTGDGRSDHLLDGLGMAGRLDAKGSCHVDILKLPHHGSERDMTKQFLQQVTADTYVASANGRYGNPDLPTLTWIVEVANDQKRKIEIVVTNQTPSTDALQKKFPPAKSSYQLRLLPKGERVMLLSLAE